VCVRERLCLEQGVMYECRSDHASKYVGIHARSHVCMVVRFWVSKLDDNRLWSMSIWSQAGADELLARISSGAIGWDSVDVLVLNHVVGLYGKCRGFVRNTTALYPFQDRNARSTPELRTRT
jgi:hypothetical protein